MDKVVYIAFQYISDYAKAEIVLRSKGYKEIEMTMDERYPHTLRGTFALEPTADDLLSSINTSIEQ